MAVQIIEGFVAPEDCPKYYEYLEKFAYESGRPGITNALGYESSLQASQVGAATGAVMGQTHPLNTELGEIFERVNAAAEAHAGIELSLCQGSYQLLTEGAKNPLHADSVKLDGTPIQPDGEPEELEWSGLLYLNNYEEDFQGGELTFPLFDLRYLPKAGDLILFKGDLEHQHDVALVTGGKRRNIVFFWARRGNVSDNRSYFEY
jgi:predicted 2-oxoglutarate/Fe(II)-dependent dioxygenase YbiX